MKETVKLVVSNTGTNVEFKAKTAFNVAETIEAIFGCKWSLRILTLIRDGINRPTAIERALEGLTPKVQNYYFRRMIALKILERVVFAEVPPRVEYHLTGFGERLLPLLDAIVTLQRELEAEVDSE